MLTSTTAPGKAFSSRAELAEHYKSDWHKYNLKRREAGLPLLEDADFKARWEAALALRKEKEDKARSGTDHIKPSKKNKISQKQKATAKVESSIEPATPEAAEERDEIQEKPQIDPLQSLFDSHMSDSLEENVDYMQQQYGFFIPDQECLIDLENLLGYCHEKIKLGHYCLYCEKIFPTWQGCQKHMISKQHTKLRYEQGFWEDLDPFYDFKREDTMFWGDGSAARTPADEAVGGSMDEGDDDEWEDVPDEEGQDEEALYDGYEKEIARFGLNVTALGELVFPDGRIVGHRALWRYYKQRVKPDAGTATVAARQAAGERVYEGQVVNINQLPVSEERQGNGKGILIPLKGGVGGFSALSLYRYKASIQKQHRGDDKGRLIRQRTTRNTNRMDKKANRLANGVSVAHAKR